MGIEGLIIFGVINFVAALFSGISGGGGGFIITPVLILLGLSPAQAVSSGKFAGLSIALGSLSGMKKAQSKKQWRRIIPIIILAFVIGLIAPFIIQGLDPGIYQRVLGILLLLMIPVLVFKKVGYTKQETTKAKTYLGGALLSGALFLQAVFSGGLGTLVNVVLMGMMGMSAIEANIVKRYSQLILNLTIVIGVLWSGLLIWPVIMVAIITALAGGFIGGKLAVRKGNKFAMVMFLIAMAISGILLLFGQPM